MQYIYKYVSSTIYVSQRLAVRNAVARPGASSGVSQRHGPSVRARLETE